jgi:tRNA pseudouridine55 synthase
MDGIIIINKPKDYTSHDVVNIARRVLKTKQIGHIGTLDPNATGVLVLCVNRATKLVKYFENHDKKYIATIKLGIKTDTDDITGNVINKVDIDEIDHKKVYNTVMSFLGKQSQVPPKYSAIKINGKKLYNLARNNQEMPIIKPREIEVKEISDFEFITHDSFMVSFKVSKGTYIRSIARDIGDKLGIPSTLQELIRTEIDYFKLEEAIDIEDFKNGKYEIKDPFDYLGFPKVVVNELNESYIDNGRMLDLSLFDEKTDTLVYNSKGEILAIYRYDEDKNVMRMSVKWC